MQRDEGPPRVSGALPGPRSRELGRALDAVDCPAFLERRRERALTSDDGAGLVLAAGRGANLFDADENRYVDLAAGFGAAILGHGPSPAHEAAAAQIAVLAQGLGDLYASDVKIALLGRLCALFSSGPARALLCQSGADALTAAIKTAVLATGKPGLVAFEGSYHGLSYAPLAACGFRASFREPFAAQLGDHVRFVPYPRAHGDVEAAIAAARAALASGTIGAVLVEPVLGRGGVVVPPAGFLVALREAARDHGALFVADEIWTGMGRAGDLATTIAAGLDPDIVCLGKGLGASIPISACVARDEVMAAWARGGRVVHTSTHAGAPLGCAAALATLDTLAEKGLPDRARTLGSELVAALREAGLDARGQGLLVGIEVADGARGIQCAKQLLERGYVVTSGGRAGEVVVVTPPLTIREDLLFGFVPVVADVVRKLP